jgi:hypothetical protein
MPKKSHARFWTVIGTILCVFVGLLWFSATRPHVQSMQYDQFLAVMLTALGVVLAGLALVVGIVAILGYQKISDIAAEEAQKAAQSYLREYLGGTSPVMKRRMVASKKKSFSPDVSSSETGPTDSADAKNVAKRYPKKEDAHGDH